MLFYILSFTIFERILLSLTFRVINGRYTKSITEYEVILPRKVKENGAFHSFRIRHSYSEHDRRKAGMIRIGSSTFYIEPVEGQEPEESGEHLHVVFKRSLHESGAGERCASPKDWWNAWAEEMYLASKRIGKRSDSRDVVPRYMELCVVSDLKFIEFHKSLNLEEYVLTIMNIVSDYYHDESIGNLIDIVVVRLVFLKKEKEELDLAITPQAQKTLDSFCKWQIGINPKDHNHPNHHDIAVLLTRYDLCSSSKSACSLLGLAFVGTACNPKRNCCINEDTGLMLGATVAHELGHNMGCAHDSPADSGCVGKVPDGSDTVMSPTVGHSTTIWSNCSRDFITNLFMNQMGECLLDEPKDHNYLTSEMPVGAVYDADQQCKFLFGEEFITCNMGGAKKCEKLWCKKYGSTNCVSRGTAYADGTICGTGKWCYNRQCIRLGERPEAVDGGWSDWGRWTDCSRTCGGGVTVRQRLCTQPKPAHGGKYCTGTKREYKMCSTEPCPEKSPRFREVQCSEHNQKPFKGNLYTWTPYPAPESDPNPCALYCLNEKRSLVKLEPRVKDGTKCFPGKKDTCIHGVCMQVGCDWGIESDAVEDICGICNGDGSHCKITSGIYTATGKSGYQKIIEIPTGSMNIDVNELKPSENMLALGHPNGTIFFNNNFTERIAGEYKVAGVEGLYLKPEPDLEELHIKGPTKEYIALFYSFFKSTNPGVKYQFVVPSAQPTYQPVYHWEFIEWSECSAKCGGGTEISKAGCVEARDGKVKASFCDANTRPEPKTRACNLQKCRRRWKTWAWGECSGCMYRTGERTREVECVMELPSHSDGDEVIVDPSECCGPRPPNKELCNSSKPCNSTATNTTKIKMKRWTNPLDEEFINFSYNLTGVEDFVKTFIKRSTGHWLRPISTKNETPPVVEDHISPDDIVLFTANLSQCNANFMMNLSETEFEDVGDTVPMFVPDRTQVFMGEDAARKLKDLSGDGRNRRLGSGPSVSIPEEDLLLNITSTTSGQTETTSSKRTKVKTSRRRTSTLSVPPDVEEPTTYRICPPDEKRTMEPTTTQQNEIVI